MARYTLMRLPIQLNITIDIALTGDLKGALVKKYGPQARANSKGGGGMVTLGQCL